jgi:type IV secretion system protein VirB4
VLRKANCLVLMATQSLSDAANPVSGCDLESTATKMFAQCVCPRRGHGACIAMGLNARQIDILAATQKRHYYVSRRVGGCMTLRSPRAGFVENTRQESVAAIKALKPSSDGWVHEWLRRRASVSTITGSGMASPTSSRA